MVHKKETIFSLEYYRIFSEHETVQKLGEDWFLKDNQKMAKQILKKKMPFPMRDQKVITYFQEKIEVQSAYSVEPDLVSSLLKKGQHFLKMSEAIKRSLENKFKKDKKANVKKLMAFFEIPEDAKDFYACVLGSVEGVMQDEVDEFDENEPFV